MTLQNNPWSHFKKMNRQRVNAALKYDAFWIVDYSGQYGLMIQFDKNFIPKDEIRLRGIQIQLDNTSFPNKLIILLQNKKDWQIFLVLCKDLIRELEEKNDQILDRIMKRLIRWQNLLQKTTNRLFSKEGQMGLYSELYILLNYILPKYGYDVAIQGWVGALGDKQDFLLEECAIEVKSYRVTAKNAVWISSKEQLNSEKKPLYLFACAIREGKNGETIADLFNSIRLKIQDEDILKDFVNKMESYGFFPELEKKSLFRFNTEIVTGYLVDSNFPKISIESVSPWITNLKYRVDLSGCLENKIDVNTIFD